MKKIFFFFTLIWLAACQQAPNIEQLEPADAQQRIISNPKVQIIDVRTAQEFQQAHLFGAQHMDMQHADFASRIESLDPNETVVVYCLSGARSQQVSTILSDKGFKKIINLQGGLMAWNASNLPLETGKKAQEQKPGMSLGDYQALIKNNASILVDFNATWCGPCKQLAPILAAFVKTQKGKVTLINIDVDQNPELAKALGIEAIPYVERYEKGKLKWKKVGLFAPEELN